MVPGLQLADREAHHFACRLCQLCHCLNKDLSWYLVLMAEVAAANKERFQFQAMARFPPELCAHSYRR